MMTYLHLLLRADWLVETANARWQSQHPGHWGEVWFESIDRVTRLAGFSIMIEPRPDHLTPGLAGRLLAFIERNKDILNLDLVPEDVVRALTKMSSWAGNRCSCTACREEPLLMKQQGVITE